MNQAVRVGKDVSEADCAGRLDLRDWQMVTIDGEDAKDLDDAVSLTMKMMKLSAGSSYCGCYQLCTGEKCSGSRSTEAWDSVYLADRVR